MPERFAAVQEAAFVAQLALAADFGLPGVILVRVARGNRAPPPRQPRAAGAAPLLRRGRRRGAGLGRARSVDLLHRDRHVQTQRPAPRAATLVPCDRILLGGIADGGTSWRSFPRRIPRSPRPGERPSLHCAPTPPPAPGSLASGGAVPRRLAAMIGRAALARHWSRG